MECCLAFWRSEPDRTPMDFLWEMIKRRVSDPVGDRLGDEPPWKSKTVILAAITTGAGFMAWMGEYSPALMRFGGSYLGGFAIGWIFRRFVKMAILAAGSALLVIGVLKGTGWITLDWVALEAWVHQTLASLQAGAEGLKQVLMGYLPSAGSAGTGLFFGFRKK